MEINTTRVNIRIQIIKESEGNMFNPIFKKNVQGRKHPGSCAYAEPELLM